MKHVRVFATGAGMAYAAFLLACCVSSVLHAGRSAEMGGLVLGLDPPSMALHQVWLLSARMAVALKLADPVATLNGLSALFAGAGLCVLLVVFRRLLVCAMSHLDVSTLFLQGGDDPDHPPPPAGTAHAAMILLDEEFSKRERVAVALGTIGAGLVYAFSVPFWMAATRAGSYALDTLLLLVAVWLTSAFCLRPTLPGACLASAVVGIGLAETPVFLVAACALAFFYLRTLLRFELPIQRYFIAAVVSGCLGLAVQIGLASLLLREAQGGVAMPAPRIVRALVDGHLAALVDVGASPNWMWSLLWAGIPFVIALCLSLSGQLEARLGTLAALVLGSGALGVVLLNFPYTPGSVWRGRGEVSIIAALAIVFAAGYFLARWFLVATVQPWRDEDFADEDDDGRPDETPALGWVVLRIVGAGGLLVSVSLALIQPWLNWRHVDPLRAAAHAAWDWGATAAPIGGGEDRPDGLVLDPAADAPTVAAAAMALLDEGRVDEVERLVLPRLSRLKPPLDRDRMDLIRARLLLARGGRSMESARILLLRLLPRGLAERDRMGEWLLQISLAKQDWSLAERDAQTVLKLNPRHLRANEVLGRALLKRSAPRLAAIHLRQTLGFATNAVLLTAFGEACLRDDQPEQAETVLREAIRQPDVAEDAYLLLARALAAQGRAEEVAACVSDTPESLRSPELLLLLAGILRADGRIQECRQVLDELNARRGRMTQPQLRELDTLARQAVSEDEPD